MFRGVETLLRRFKKPMGEPVEVDEMPFQGRTVTRISGDGQIFEVSTLITETVVFDEVGGRSTVEIRSRTIPDAQIAHILAVRAISLVLACRPKP